MTGDQEVPFQSKVQFTTAKFVLHKFAEEIAEKKIIFQVIKMLDSIFIYINDKERLQFNDLSLAMQNRYDSCPMGTRLIGNFTDDTSKNMACRLGKKIKKAVFVSCNLEPDVILIPLVEKRLYEELKNYPDKF